MNKNIVSSDDTKKMISSLYDEFEKERKSLRNQYDNNLQKLDEIDENISSYLKYEDDNKVFSPRNISNKNEDKIIELREQKQVILAENRTLLEKLHYYENKVKQLTPIIEDTSDDDLDNSDIVADEVNSSDSVITTSDSIAKTEVVSNNESNSTIVIKSSSESTVKPVKKTENNLADQIQYVLSKVKLCSGIIDNDIVRTKMELRSVENFLDDLYNTLKDE